MSAYQPAIDQLLATNEQISAICILDNAGSVLHSVNEWQVDGTALIQSIVERKPAVEIQGIKYSSLQIDPVRLIASNRQGQGHVVASKIGEKGWIVAYVIPEGDMQGAYLNTVKAANQLKTVM